MVRWVFQRVVGLGKGGGGGWLALLICKTANLQTLCLPTLLFVLSTFSTVFSSYGGPIRSFSLSLSPTLCISTRPLFLPCARFSALANTHTNPHCHSLALAIPVSLSCVPSSLRSCKLYVPTLATLNAGLARDNPQPSLPLSATAAPPEPSAVLPISATRRLPLFSPLTNGSPGFTTS